MGLERNLDELEELRRLLTVTEKGAAFGKEVRLARTKRGMTLDALAAATGVAKSYLSQIETGYAGPPRDEKVRKIAEAIGMDPESLVDRAHLSQLPAELKERMARLGRMFDSTEGMIRALMAARNRAAPPGHTAAEGAVAGGGEQEAAAGEEAPIAIDLNALHKSGLLHHLAEWGDEPVEPRTEARWDPEHWIPVINRISAGPPQGFTDLDFPAGIADEYLPRPPGFEDKSAFALRIDGDSMEPKYHQGDTVVFSPAARVDSGDDCFVRFEMSGGPVDGDKTFKRVFFDPEGQIRLQPINDRYPPAIVKRSDVAKICRAVIRYEKL